MFTLFHLEIEVLVNHRCDLLQQWPAVYCNIWYFSLSSDSKWYHMGFLRVLALSYQKHLLWSFTSASVFSYIVLIFKPGFYLVVSVVSVVSVLLKKFLRQIQPYGNLTHNRPIRQIRQIHTCSPRWKWFYLLQQIQQEMGVTRQHFVNGNHRKRLIRQIQQKCVPKCTSFCRCYGSRSNRYYRYNNMETQDT